MATEFRILNNRALLITRDSKSDSYASVTHFSSGTVDITVGGLSVQETNDLIKTTSELRDILIKAGE